MAETEASLRAGIVATCRSMAEQGLNQGTAGNVSARFGDGLLITPSGLPYEEMTPDDIVPMTMDGRPSMPSRPPPSGASTATSCGPAPTSRPSSTPTRPTAPPSRCAARTSRRPIT